MSTSFSYLGKVFLCSVILYNCAQSKKQETANKLSAETDSILLPEPTLLYGIEIDSFEVVEGTIKWNQNLSDIVSNFNVDYKQIHLLSQRSEDVYSVRKLKAKAPYTLIHERDSMKTLRQFIFEPNATEFVVYHFADSVCASLHQKPVITRGREIAAEIESSVYNSLIDQGASPLLVNQLVDVFAWQVDFFRIDKGDEFKILFEEDVVDDKIVAIKSIEGAYFKHRGKEFYAIPYPTGDKMDFYDEEGKSLRKTFLKAPLNYSRISSRYSLRRFHPVQKRYKAHLGTDYAAPRGTPIRTVGDGVVVEAGYHRGNGNYVKVRHNSNYTTQYLHMSKIASGIKKGVQVKQGKTIGYVGSTGLATGPHLCFRFWKNGKQVDALKVDLPSSSGIAPENLDDFKIKMAIVREKLDNLITEKHMASVAEIQKQKSFAKGSSK
ncbi:MAG: peptidoglycan DD-metalloendopeptidase family protein [Bacteroidota bacterium]